MGNSHIHLFAPGQSVTCVASADMTGGRLVEITGPRAVAHAAANSAKVFGTAATDAKSGDDVLVLRGGWETPKFVYIPVYPIPDFFH